MGVPSLLKITQKERKKNNKEPKNIHTLDPVYSRDSESKE